MNKKRKAVTITVGAICVLAIIALAVYNISTNCHFWEVSAANIATILIALIVSFYLVQRKNDQRKQKEILLDLLFKVQHQLEDEKAYNFANQKKEEILMRNRNISNRIQILENIQNTFSIEKDVVFIKEKFDEYQTLIGNHISDIPYLCSSTVELKRPLDLIVNRLILMAISLYK